MMEEKAPVQMMAESLGIGVGAVVAKIREMKSTVNIVRIEEPESEEGRDVEVEDESRPGRWRLQDLSRTQCRYATTPDDAKTHYFCGEPKMFGSSHPWCTEHYHMVYPKAPKPIMVRR
jgi:hypothetical protein